MKSEEALEWIIGFIESNDMPYLICGGLAAIAYGSRRPLHDIDLYVSEQNYRLIVDFGCDFITYGPDRYIDNSWNVEYVQFIYKGQKIEVGSSKDIAIYDAFKGDWYQKKIDFSNYVEKFVLGKNIRIMDKQTLIDYKRKLNREVDRADIEQIGNA